MKAQDFLQDDDMLDYSDASSVRDELFLSEVPQNIMLDCIKRQFKHPFEENNRDYVQSWIQDYQYSDGEVNGDDEQNALDEAVARFITTMKQYFKKYLSIGFPDMDDKPEEEQLEILHICYRYFLLNIRKNFTTLVLNVIEQDRTILLEEIEKNNDVVTATLPKGLDPEIRTIIGNLGTVTRNILHQDFDSIDQFVEFTLCTKNEMECTYVQELISSEKLVGNFIPQYIKYIQLSDIADIMSKVRKNLIKFYITKEEQEGESEED